LRFGEIAIMDHRSGRKHATGPERFEMAGAALRFLARTGMERNSIVSLVSRLNAMPARKAGQRTVSGP